MAPSTTTQEEFLRLLDQNAVFRQQVRRYILSAELLELPEMFASFASRVDEFITEQRETNTRADIRLKALADDIGVLKDNVVSRATRDHAETIPSLLLLDLEYVNILIRSDLIALLRRISDIDKGHRLGFYRADLMLQAVDADGATHYVAVEASYTADQRDTNRALRNAEYLQRCTDCPTHAVIASIKNDHEVQLLVEDGTVHWFQLTREDLNPE
ncbi:MAG: hypothetical protein OXC13_02010 [Caldilineaceae bacterium]|nr:hypothetical protein [Caldilineaceae bacterium]